MRSFRYHEIKQRGSVDFPLDYHYLHKSHTRYEMPYHWHEETEILFVCSGLFSLSLDGEGLELGPGDAAFIAPGSLHAGTPHDCVYQCIVFDLRMLLNAPGLCRELMGEIVNRKASVQSRFEACDPIAAQTLRPLFQGLLEAGAGTPLTTLGFLYAFFGMVYDCHAYTTGGIRPDETKQMLLLKEVFDLIESRFSQRLTLDDLASAVHLDRKYFCRFFKQATHLTPMAYLQYYRVEQACCEMQATDKNVTEIALDVGFATPEYFARVFKKPKGLPPRSYLARVRALP